MASANLRISCITGAIIAGCIAAAYLIVGAPSAKSFAYGSLVAIIGALILNWRHWQAKRRLDVSAGWVLRHAYKTAIERYIWAAIMLALGFKIMKLAPTWLLAGFITGQIVWLFVSIWISKIENAK